MRAILTIMLSSICILSSTILITAQNQGLKAGLVFSNVTGPSNGSISPGLQLGVYKKLGGEEVLTFKVELLITQKGSNNYNRSNLQNLNLLYLDLPLFFNLELINKFNLNFGFGPSMLLFGSYRYTENGDIVRRSVGKELNKFDLNTLLGLEYIWNDNILLGIRYNHSFVPISGYESEFYRDGKLPFNRVFQFYCGYRFK